MFSFRYQPETTAEEDDEHDDYGFNRRPSVRGIKPRFGSTNEILQQIQNQLQPPTTQAQPQPQPRQANHTSWPYYSETGLDKTRTSQTYSTYSYPIGPPDMQRYRPTSLIEEGIYQNCPNQMCTQLHYSQNVMHPPIMRIGGGCSDIYSTIPAQNRTRTGRPESPPPMDMSRSFHQTMVLIPYNRIEGFQPGNVSPNPIYSSSDQCNYARYATATKYPQNPPKRYPEGYASMPRMAHPVHPDDPNYQMKMAQKPIVRVPYSGAQQPVQVHLMTSRSESPLPGQFATARATQTPSATLSSCGYYPGPPNQRYRPAIGPVNAVPHNGTIWHDGMYSGKINRHSFPAGGPRYAIQPDNISLADSETQQTANGFRQTNIETQFPQRETSAPSSPTKNSRFTSERGVPEGAASVSPQDSTNTSTSTMTSPSSPQNPPVGNGKSMFYAMNV